MTEGDKIELETGMFKAFKPVVFWETDDDWGYTNATLEAKAFKLGTAASTADHRIIYDSATGALFYDADGMGKHRSRCSSPS